MKHYWLRFWRVTLSLLVLVSLLLSVANAIVLLGVKQRWDHFLARLQQGEGAIPLEVHVDYEVPIRTTVPISQAVQVPIAVAYPVSLTVTTSFDLPLLGEQEVVLPVHTVIPISHTLLLPLRADFPVSLTYRLQGDLPVVIKLSPEWISHLMPLQDDVP